MAPQPVRSISEQVRRHARTKPDAAALYFLDRTTTYAQLNDRGDRVAAGLAALGVRPGDRVAHLDANHPTYFEVLLGTVRAGASLTSVNWRLAPPEISFILRDSDAHVLFVGEQFVHVIDKITEDLDQVEVIIVVGHSANYQRYETWAASHEPAAPFDGGLDDVVVQYYTSGTTGPPKGAMLSNRNLLALSESGLLLGIDDDAVVQACMPLFHVSGSGVTLFGLYAGRPTVLLPAADPEQILATIERHRVTNTVFVPSLIQILMRTPEVERTDLSSLRAIAYGGSPISPTVLREALDVFGCEFTGAFGMTESTGGCVMLMPEDHDPAGPREYLLESVGKPVGEHEVRIVDPEALADREPREVGEVWIKGPQVMVGYHNNPQATAETIVDGGWLRTGDAGYLDEDGYLYICDRVKDMIISGGENVYPAEVEHALMAHPGVMDVAVIGVPHDKWGETPKAIVMPVPDAEPTEDELIGWARTNLAHYKCPTSVEFVTELPRNATGKILKYELREPYWKGHDRRVN